MATLQDVLNEIQTYVVANGNNEITANVLRPVLETMANFVTDVSGDLSNLNTANKDNIVEAINEALQAVNTALSGGASSGSYKGSFADLAALNAAHPTGVFGDFAIVLNNGIEDGFFEYNWSEDSSSWEEVTGAQATDILMKIWGSDFEGVTPIKFEFNDADFFVEEMNGGGVAIKTKKYYDFALSDEESDLVTGVVYYSELMRPITDCTSFDFSVKVAPTGSVFEVDVLKNGLSVFDTLPTIDAGETSTLTATIPQVITGGSVTFDAGDTISINITQVGTTTPAANLKGQITYK